MPLRREDKIGGPDRIFGVPSSRGTGVHEVIRWKSGVWSCNCTDWIIRRAKHGDHSERTGEHCTHIKDCIAKKVKPVGTAAVNYVAQLKSAEGRAVPIFGREAV